MDLKEIAKDITLLAMEKGEIRFDKKDKSQEEITADYAKQVSMFYNTVYENIRDNKDSITFG